MQGFVVPSNLMQHVELHPLFLIHRKMHTEVVKDPKYLDGLHVLLPEMNEGETDAWCDGAESLWTKHCVNDQNVGQE